MAVPKKKTTRGKTNKRRVHISLKPVNLIVCPQCNRLKKSHVVCLSCGFYKGREVIDVVKKLKVKDKKIKDKTQGEKIKKTSQSKKVKPKTKRKTPKSKTKEREDKKIFRRKTF